MSRILGIDLGTTNSCMAVMEGGEPVVIPNAEERAQPPRFVAFTKTGERVVGQAAKRQAVTNPSNTIFSAKRLIGRKFTEIREEAKNMPFKVVEGKNGDAYIEVKLGAKVEQFAPQQDLRLRPGQAQGGRRGLLGEKITQAVITVPAYFKRLPAPGDQGCRQDRRPRGPAHHQRADGGIAGLRPSTRKKDEKIAVFDLAGAPSTSRCSRSATGCSRSRRPTATPTSAATTGTMP